MELVYIAGAPATGKSTLMAELTRGARRVTRDTIKYLAYEELLVNDEITGIELGRRRVNFPGTDTLAMGVMPVVCEWIGKQVYPVVCAEGDRLAKVKFLDTAGAAGYQVNFFLLQAPTNVLDERCEVRGSKQDRSWRTGRVTAGIKVAAHAERAGYRVTYLDACRPVRELADIVCEKVPVMRQLREGAL